MIGHDGLISALTLLPNSLLASSSYDQKIMIWNVNETSPLYTLSGHNDSVRGLVVLNNEYLTSCSNDTPIKLWSLSNYEEVNSWKASDVSIEALAFDPKLNVLVSAGSENEIRIWGSGLWRNISSDSGKRFQTLLAYFLF